MKNNSKYKLIRAILMVLFLFLMPFNGHAETKESIFQKGITGNALLDYFILPFLMTIIIFIIFKKHFITLTKKIESAKDKKATNKY